MKIAKSSEKGWQCLGAEPFLFTLPGPARDPARKYTPRDLKLIISKHPCTHLAPTPRHKRNEIKKKDIIIYLHLIPSSDGGPFERPPPISTDNPPTNAPCLIPASPLQTANCTRFLHPKSRPDAKRCATRTHSLCSPLVPSASIVLFFFNQFFFFQFFSSIFFHFFHFFTFSRFSQFLGQISLPRCAPVYAPLSHFMLQKGNKPITKGTTCTLRSMRPNIYTTIHK